MKRSVFQKPVARTRRGTPTRIILTGKRAAVIGPGLIFDTYRAVVATIVVGLDADISLKTLGDEDEESRRGPISIIAPGTLCQLKTEGSVALIFCDVLSDDYTQIDVHSLGRKIVSLRELLRRGPAHERPNDYLDQIFTLIGASSERTLRPDIARIVAAIGTAPENFATVDSAAALVNLSPMRFQHVFTETVGVPFRRYRQWRRMGRVVRAMADGVSLTKAAYAAGFANSAHLSTSFKAMFGLSPSDLVARQAEYHLSNFAPHED